MDCREVDSCFERRREELLGYTVMLLDYLTAAAGDLQAAAAAAAGAAAAAAGEADPQNWGSQRCLTDLTNFDYWLVRSGGQDRCLPRLRHLRSS